MKLVFNPITGNLDYVASIAADVGLAGLATNITVGKTLTLIATNDYSLTVPATGTVALLQAANVFTVNQFIDGSTDAIQLRVQGHSSQTANLQTWENSSAGVLGGISGTGNFSIGIPPSSVYKTYLYALDTSTSGTVLIHRTETSFNPASASSSNVTNGYFITATAGAQDLTGQLTAVQFLAQNLNTSPTSNISIVGVQGNATQNSATGKVSNITGGSFVSAVTGAGTVFDLQGINVTTEIRSSGTISGFGGKMMTGVRIISRLTAAATSTNINLYGIDVNSWGNLSTGGGTVTSAYAINVVSPSVTGAVTNAYGLYLNSISGAASLNYAIYTNAGLNRIGDQLAIVGSADRTQLQATGYATQTNPVGYLIDNTAATNTVRNVLKLETQSTGTAANGLGAGLLFSLETATASTMQTAAQIAGVWADATNATRKAKLQLSAYDTAIRTGLEIEATGSDVTLLALGKLAFTQTDLNEYIDSLNDGYIDYRATTGHRFGDGTNQTQLAADGHQTMAGTAKPWEDLRIEPSVRQAAGTGVPAFEKYFDDAAGTSKGVFLYSFTDESVAGNEKEIFFTMQTPHAWDGGPISMHVHFVPAATVNTSDIIWGLEYAWKDIGEVFGDTAIVYSSTTLQPDDANITAGKHYIAEFADITPGATADGLSSILIGRLFRNSSAAGDTYTNKVGLLYIDAHYQLSSLGSTDEYTK